MEQNYKPIRITNKKAIRLAKQRAIQENRSAANAAAQTIIEALSGADDNDEQSECQAKNGAKP